MTLEEKVGQMVQYSGGWDLTGPATNANTQLKKQQIEKGLVGSMLNVTSVEQVREAQKLAIEKSRLKIPMLFGFDVIHGYKTMFPIPLGEAASWDLDLMQRTAAVSAKEATAAGVNWTFAPMVDISRDARWGRIMESAGEDTYLNTQVGLAKMKGYQGEDLANPTTMAACAKHFAGYGFVEAGKEYNTVNIGENEFHNAVLPPFKVLAEAGIATFMNSFSDMDGLPATASHELQKELLKEKWNYKGFVVSDWGSIKELETHGVTANLAESASMAVQAGNDMDMESNAYAEHLVQLVEDEVVAESRVNDAVGRILNLKFQLGLFDNPYKYCDEAREKTDIMSKENMDLAYEAALKSMVLLKNENQILPISDEVKSIALIGPLANDKNTPLGNWRGKAIDDSAVSVYEGLKGKLSNSVELSYHEGIDFIKGGESFGSPLKINTTDNSKIEEAVKLAKSKELVVLVVGESAFQSGEGRSQANIGFAGLQNELIEAVYEANPNTIMVLMNGRPMDISWSAKHFPAILEAWHLGSQAGNAIADVLLGNYNPSGKLTVSFPRSSGQEPFYYNHKNTGRPTGSPNEVVFSNTTDVNDEPLFPFGFGLSYTSFDYGEIKLSKNNFNKGEKLTAEIEVTNSGDRFGEEVVQLYIRDLVASRTRPVLELKAFEKVGLKPGESKTISFEISEKDIQFYTANKKWEAEAGEFKLFIGPHSEELKVETFHYE
ncbi:glycosyl hydrolase [Psychroflexus planctonicus]|uniref:beta-glucosidase n=2 Tax=Psychroflexus planctonicus TaxID=1526575 RepID=A0ABQ1SFX0_9FLAO|nr:glycosyl hydrolase [Psychroflexus planctonicus]